jgi:hypothetical protein
VWAGGVQEFLPRRTENTTSGDLVRLIRMGAFSRDPQFNLLIMQQNVAYQFPRLVDGNLDVTMTYS